MSLLLGAGDARAAALAQSFCFHPLWLRDNCPSQRHPGTRQRLRSPADLPLSLTVSSIAVADDTLHVHWEDRTEPSAFSGSWLRSIGVQEGESGSALSGGHTSPTDTARYDPPSVMRMHFDELRDGGDAARWKLASALGEDGAMLLEGVPSVCSPISSVANQPRRDDGPTPTTDPEAVTDGVRAIAEILGPLQPNIYGELFDVVSAGDAAINIVVDSSSSESDGEESESASDAE